MSQSQPVNRPMTALEWTMLAVLAAVWGGTFFFNAIAVKELPVFTIVVARVSLAALVLLAVLKIAGIRMPPDRRVWIAFFGMGLLNNIIPFLLIVWGQQHIASGVASILNATTPLFTVVLAHMLTTDEKMSGGRLVGVLAGIVGVVIMIGSEARQALGTNILAQLAVLGAALSYGFAGLYGRRFREMGVAPVATAIGQLTASSAMLMPIMLVVDQPWTLPMPSLTTMAALLALAAVSTAFAYVLFFRLLASAGATNVSLVTLLIPVSAILLGTTFLGEHLAPRHLAGMAMIGLGLAAIDGRPWRKLQLFMKPQAAPRRD